MKGSLRALVLGLGLVIALPAMAGDHTRPTPRHKKKATKVKGGWPIRDADAVKRRLEREGWRVIGNPNQLQGSSIFSVIKGSTGGAVVYSDMDNKAQLDAFEDAMRRNADTIIVRKGKRMLTVIMPGKYDEAEKLLKLLMKP